MGGYGYFVWMSFGVTALALCAECTLLKLQRNRTVADLQTSLQSPVGRGHP
jgi:heme exporter protein CcmD